MLRSVKVSRKILTLSMSVRFRPELLLVMNCEGALYWIGFAMGVIVTVGLVLIWDSEHCVYQVVSGDKVLYTSTEKPAKNGEFILLGNGKVARPEDNAKIYKCFEQ